MKIITSFANPIIKAIKALAQKKERNAQGLFYAEGLQQIGIAAECGVLPTTLLVTEDVLAHKVVAPLLKQIHERDVLLVTEDILGRISARDNAPQAIGVYAQKPSKIADLKPAADDIWVVLEAIKDPGNLGTIIRTVDAVGARGVVLLDDCCDVYSVECVRAGMGSHFAIEIILGNGADFRAAAGAKKWDIIGTALQGAVDVGTAKFSKPLFLAMGCEQSGLSKDMRLACTQLVKLPMHGRAESLNVAVATGVMLYKMIEV